MPDGPDYSVLYLVQQVANGFFTATPEARAKFANGFFDAATVLALFAAASIPASVIEAAAKVTGAANKMVTGSTAAVVDGTVICTLTAAAGKQFVGIAVAAKAEHTAGGPGLKMKLTYSDGTNETITVICGAGGYVGNRAGMTGAGPTTNGNATGFNVANAAKLVTAIEVQVAGTGAGTKEATISAIEVAQ